MTLRTNARLAGFAFLFYIAVGITSLILFGRALHGAEGAAAKLAAIAQHATQVRLTVVLTLLEAVCAIVLGVTLYALTRDVDRDLAVMAMSFRVAEGVIAATATFRTLGLLSIATGAAAASAADQAAANALGGVLFDVRLGESAAFCFACGSTIFSCLFLRGRTIPVWLAWLGVFASVVILVLQPLGLAGFVGSPITDFMWIPMGLFEVTLAILLIAKGVQPQAAKVA